MAPLLLLFWLGSALCARELVPKQCLLGPEFWCRDPGTAAQCGRQHDCKLLEQHMPQQGWHIQEQTLSPKCTICTLILKKLKSMVGDDPDEGASAGCCQPGALLSLLGTTPEKSEPVALASGGGLVPPRDACDFCLTLTSLAQPDLRHMRPGWDLGDVLNGTCKRHFGASPRCKDFVSTYHARLLRVLRVPQDPLTTCPVRDRSG
ncbi:hypothetical protein UY3_16649 [Chelonia mydas]|uniref:Saposin A-type domain-containing protein n=1 Tax=Chelonia mydas TaxID=8469 RepID=M7BDJ4_CHEMY|nr:hypothetical protein UY3_16649 [Chelonia mydas]